MRWTAKERIIPTNWHSWFVWHPVRIGNERVWLERIERRIIPDGDSRGDWSYWEYRV